MQIEREKEEIRKLQNCGGKISWKRNIRKAEKVMRIRLKWILG